MPQRETDNNTGLSGITGRLTMLERICGDLERKVSGLEDRNETLMRLSFSMEHLAEENKSQNTKIERLISDQSVQNEKNNMILSEINQNLSNINNSQSTFQKDLDEQKNKVSDMEEDMKGKDKNIIKRVVDFIVAVALAYVLIQFGLK